MSHRQLKRVRRTARTAFVTAVSLDLLAIALPMQASAQDTGPAENLEEITVTGIRAAQQRAIDLKRTASQIIDSISAEDIGKLPDGTISDSLQRIPGVQIRREAGEGSAVNVRGLPQVATMLNGEQYLGANSITNVQPNFGDIPSQLFAGVDVIKTPTADLLNAGTTGTINLKTRRPLDLNNGFSSSFAAEAAYGDGKGEVEPQANGLIGWRGEKTGALLSVSYSDVTQANYYNGLQGNSGWSGLPGESASWPNDSTGDVNGDGDTTSSSPSRGTRRSTSSRSASASASMPLSRPRSVTACGSRPTRSSPTRRSSTAPLALPPKTNGNAGSGSRRKRARRPAP
ncbi:MAG: TonB-dependent receptor plug domain-containing protein [Peristeroidobacter soli]